MLFLVKLDQCVLQPFLLAAKIYMLRQDEFVYFIAFSNVTLDFNHLSFDYFKFCTSLHHHNTLSNATIINEICGTFAISHSLSLSLSFSLFLTHCGILSHTHTHIHIRLMSFPLHTHARKLTHSLTSLWFFSQLKIKERIWARIRISLATGDEQ